MLKRYMHKRERYFAMLNDNRVVRPFEWGTEFIGHEADAADPHELFKQFSRNAIETSDQYFAIPSDHNFVLGSMPHESEPGAVATGFLEAERGRNPVGTAPGSDSQPRLLRWQSSVTTPSPENNTAYATYFPHKNHRAAVI